MQKSEKKRQIELIIEIFVIVFIAIITIITHNNLVTRRSKVEEQYAQIENVLQNRLEKIPDLVAVVKNYASHEQVIFESISKARTELQIALKQGDITKIAMANEALTEALKNLNMIVENSPEIASSKLYIGLMDEVVESANRISQERRKYNQVVSEYNSLLKRFPENIFAFLFLDFREAQYFEANSNAHMTRNVDMQ